MRTCERGLWAAVLRPSRAAERTLPAASLRDLQPRRASGRGLGCGCEPREAQGVGEGLSRGPLTSPRAGADTWTDTGGGSSPGAGAAKTPWEAATRG